MFNSILFRDNGGFLNFNVGDVGFTMTGTICGQNYFFTRWGPIWVFSNLNDQNNFMNMIYGTCFGSIGLFCGVLELINYFS